MFASSVFIGNEGKIRIPLKSIDNIILSILFQAISPKHHFQQNHITIHQILLIYY